jgi:hypothetical protein
VLHRPFVCNLCNNLCNGPYSVCSAQLRSQDQRKWTCGKSSTGRYPIPSPSNTCLLSFTCPAMVHQTGLHIRIRQVWCSRLVLRWSVYILSMSRINVSDITDTIMIMMMSALHGELHSTAGSFCRFILGCGLQVR